MWWYTFLRCLSLTYGVKETKCHCSEVATYLGRFTSTLDYVLKRRLCYNLCSHIFYTFSLLFFLMIGECTSISTLFAKERLSQPLWGIWLGARGGLVLDDECSCFFPVKIIDAALIIRLASVIIRKCCCAGSLPCSSSLLDSVVGCQDSEAQMAMLTGHVLVHSISITLLNLTRFYYL